MFIHTWSIVMEHIHHHYARLPKLQDKYYYADPVQFSGDVRPTNRIPLGFVKQLFYALDAFATTASKH